MWPMRWSRSAPYDSQPFHTQVAGWYAFASALQGASDFLPSKFAFNGTTHPDGQSWARVVADMVKVEDIRYGDVRKVALLGAKLVDLLVSGTPETRIAIAKSPIPLPYHSQDMLTPAQLHSYVEEAPLAVLHAYLLNHTVRRKFDWQWFPEVELRLAADRHPVQHVDFGSGARQSHTRAWKYAQGTRAHHISLNPHTSSS